MVELVSVWLLLCADAKADLDRDLLRWPGRDYCLTQMGVNTKFDGWLKEQWHLQTGWKREMIGQVIRENKWCYNVYDWLADANRDGEMSYRREALQIFRRLIGEEAWREGVFPPAVPIWRFSEVSP